MATATFQQLDALIALCEKMLASVADDDRHTFLDVIYRNGVDLREKHIENMSLVGVSANSHDLRQPLTAIVGYASLLNSPKLADHASLTEAQLADIHMLHTLSRELHWYMDSVILFANNIVRPDKAKASDAGMLNIRGYLLAQADNYACHTRLKTVTVSEDIPLVFANDVQTKLMIRGLFSSAIEIAPDADLVLNGYTMMRTVRIKLVVSGAATRLDDVMQLLKVKLIPHGSASTTQSMITTIGSVTKSSLLELSLYTLTNLAARQGGRVKFEADEENLVITLTMPMTLAPLQATQVKDQQAGSSPPPAGVGV